MRQPRGEDSGRGFWLRLDGDAKKEGMKAPLFFPSLYFLPGRDGDACALMCAHVDDPLYCYLTEGKEVIERFLNKFNIGNTEVNDFRYCGQQFSRSGDGDIYVDTVDNTRKIKPIPIQASRSNNDKISGDDITRLGSVTGSLAWVARQTRPDLAYRVKRLQSSIKNATVSTLCDANADQVRLRFPCGHLKWDEVGLITITDASFSNEQNYRSQQGRCHFRGDLTEIKSSNCNTYRVMPLSFSSTTIRPRHTHCSMVLRQETSSGES